MSELEPMTADEVALAGRRVLVIEDEAMIGMMIEDTLADIGCEVVGSASRYNDAAAKAGSLSYEVAILDVNLGGRDTFPIAAALAERGVAFVFATGYGAASLPEALRAVPVLQKPFQQRDLARALRAALSRPGTDRSEARGGTVAA